MIADTAGVGGARGAAAREPLREEALQVAAGGGFEGALILVAAGSIAWASALRLLDPVPMQEVRAGVVITIVASLINFAAARQLSIACARAASPLWPLPPDYHA